jgi:hypothetical protein
MADNYAAYGATDYVDLRRGPLDFIGNGWTFGGDGSGFDALASIYGDGGYALIAQLVGRWL